MSTSALSAVIVGAGFAGLGMAIRLRQSGTEDFVILERAPELGGVWRDNRYPGISCDIESHLYSYSFEPNPDWSRTFAPGHEIRAYLERCADKYGVRGRIRFRCAAAGARFDAATGLWHVATSDGDTLVARFLISGAGHALTQPIVPDIPGRDSFAGAAFHSARWDSRYPLDGKRVAVIGTGASSIQIVPSIAPQVGRLLVYQRTPPWIVPRPDRDISPAERERFRRHPALAAAGADRPVLASRGVGIRLREQPGHESRRRPPGAAVPEGQRPRSRPAGPPHPRLHPRLQARAPLE